MNQNKASDFTLEELQFLVTLTETHSLTLAAERHQLSMGSASRRLTKLREFFEDQLFVRAGLSMLPTQRMREIEGDVKEVLRTMEVLLHRNVFELAKTERPVRILSADNGIATLLAECFEPFYEQVPKSQLIIEQVGPDIFDRLRDNSADLALYPISNVPKDFHVTELYKTRRGILVREGHPLIDRYEKRGRITMQDLTAYRQIRTTFPGAPEWAGPQSRTATTMQEVALEMPFFLAGARHHAHAGGAPERRVAPHATRPRRARDLFALPHLAPLHPHGPVSAVGAWAHHRERLEEREGLRGARRLTAPGSGLPAR